GFYTGVPAIIGSNGIEEILELPLDERERKGFEDACAVMKKYIEIGKSYKIV
ncbi:MAG: L-lactate dehydrogenase, partial [Fusobacterium sp.]